MGRWAVYTPVALFAVLSVVSFAPCLSAQQAPDTSSVPASVQRTRPYRRAQWFIEQRAYPIGHIPAGVRLDALNQVEQMIANESRTTAKPNLVRGLSLANGTAPAASGAVWLPMGPQPTSNVFENSPVSGRISSIVIDPNTPSTIYIGAAMGGVWKSTDSGANWTPLTDGRETLAIGAVALDPDNTQNVWVGTGESNFGADNYYGAGILKSADGGSTWTLLAQSTFGAPIQPTIGGAKIGSLAVLKGSSGLVAIAGVQFFQQSTSSFSPHSGIWRTADGGTTWTNVLAAATGDVVAWDPNNASNCGNSCISYATIGYWGGDSTNGFYRSNDSGQTWTLITGGVIPTYPSANVGRIAMGLAKNNTGATIKTTIYLGVGDSSTQNVLGMYKSTDGGTTWAALSNPPNYCTSQCFYDTVIGVVPNNDSVVFAGGAYGDQVATPSTMWRSTDGGSTWTEVSKPTGTFFSKLHADMHAIAFSPDSSTIYLGSDGGIYSSSNAPSSATAALSIVWNNLNGSATDPTKSLGTLQFYPGMSVASANLALGGTQDNGTQLFTGNYVWSEVECGDGGWSAIDPSNNNTMYTACNTGPIDIEKSTSASPAYGTFSAVTTGITTSDRALFIPPLVIDPSTPTTLYFGSFKLYQTTNSASTWTAMAGGADLTASSSGKISAIGVGTNNTVWVGTSNSKVQVTTNASLGASATFTDRSSGLPNRAITQVMPDRSDTSGATAYVTFSGFDQYNSGFGPGGDGLGYVYKTTNTGATWTNLTGNLPHSPVNDIVVDTSAPNTLYVGTDVGVFYTSNANASPPTWNTLVTGLPKSAVLSLKMDANSRTLIAGTHGRSAWRVVVGGVATLSTNALIFGAQGFGLASAPQTVVVTNTGSAAVTLNTISITNNPTEFALPASVSPVRNNSRLPACSNAMVLSGGGSCAVSVTFTPTGSGTRTGALTVNNTGSVSNLTVNLTGSGPAANAVSLLPASLSFGNVVVNGSLTMPVALSNATISAVSISGFSLPAGYSQTNNCPASLSAGAGCTLIVTFHPTTLTASSGNFSVQDAAGTQTASLSGTGANPTETLTRPGTVAGTTAAGPTTLTPSRPVRPVRSGTTTVLAGTAATVPIVFAPVGETGAATLACFGAPAGTTCEVQPSTLTLKGSPARANVRIRYADSVDSAPAGVYDVQVLAKTDSFSSVLAIPINLVSRRPVAHSDTLAGDNGPRVARSSDEPAPAAFEISATRIDFTADDHKGDPPAREITLTNKLSSPMSVSIDAPSGDFLQTNDCGGELQPASSCRISIRVKADVPFPAAGQLNITTAAGSASVELSVKNMYRIKPED